MLKDLFSQKQQYINHFFDKVDIETAEKFLNVLRSCTGNMVFSGIGKSGLVAKKIAFTMTSTGSRALYISATDALHGDIGILSPKDHFILLSKSGESEELLNLIPHLRNKGVTLLGIVSNANSRLAKACDYSMVLPLAKELCPFNLAPTTSTSIQMIFGDILAIALMRHQHFSLDQYSMNHPAGSIGKKINLKVQDLMYTGTQLPLCNADDKLVDILAELSEKRCGCILIVNKNMHLQGIFTDGDLRRALIKYDGQILDKTMKEMMTVTSRTMAPERLAWEAMQEMEKSSAITMMPVIDSKHKLLGLIRLHDIVQAGLG